MGDAASTALAVLVQALAFVVTLRLLRRRWEKYSMSSSEIEATLEAALSRFDERIGQSERLLTDLQLDSAHAGPVQKAGPRPRVVPPRVRQRQTQIEPPEAAFRAALAGKLARRRSSRAANDSPRT